MGRRSKNRPRRPDATGRSNRAARFAMMPHRVWLSEAVSSLNPNARALLLEIIAMENGSNNGAIWLSVRDATDRLGLSDFRAIQTAFDDLQDRGLIRMTKDAHFSVKASDASRARCWRLTWIGIPDGPRGRPVVATNDWEQYQAPGKTKARRRADKRQRALARYRKDLDANRLPVVDSTTMEAEMPDPTTDAVVETTTAVVAPMRKSPITPVVDSTAHTSVTMPPACNGWWEPEQTSKIFARMVFYASLAHQRPSLARAA